MRSHRPVLSPDILAPDLIAVLTALVTLLLSSSAFAEQLRPYEAPVFDEVPELPPLPAEYLKHDQGGIRFAYHPSARERVRALIDEGEAIRTALSALLGEPVLGELDVRVSVGSDDFDRVAPRGTPAGAGAVALSQLGLLVMSLRHGATSTGEVRTAFRRGMALLALEQVSGPRHLPRWIRIGFALHFAGMGSLERSRALWWASIEQRLIPIAELDQHLLDRSDHDSVAAAQAADFVAFLLEEERRVGWPLLVRGARDQPFEAALEQAYQGGPDALEAAWREDVAKHKAFLPILVAGTGLWVLLAAGVHIRRRLRGRRVEDQVALPPPKVRPPRKRRHRLPMREAEVPKVAHHGRWHTLH